MSMLLVIGACAGSTPAAVSSLPAPAAPGGISVAVLPFAIGDTAQEFFSDGMTEEIMTALAKVSALRVVGRESAFQFKDRKTDMRAVGQALGASYLVEGSVRKAGDQVRITAQLVQADNGVSLWTNSYDREMKNIFATQSDIAEAIAGALRVPLGLKQGDTLVSNRTNNLDSYQQYLRAKALVRTRGIRPFADAIALLEQVVARDPNYAPAWALLAQAYDLTPNFDPALLNGPVEELRRVVDASLPRAEAAARRAIQLDPKNPDGYLALGQVQHALGKPLLAADLYSRALALDPENPDVLHSYSVLFGDLGYLKQALRMRQQLLALEPFVPAFQSITAGLLFASGQADQAIAMLKALGPSERFSLVQIYAAQGRYGEAADILSSFHPPDVPLSVSDLFDAAVRLLRTAPATASLQTLPKLGALSFVYVYVGAPVRYLEFYEDRIRIGYQAGLGPGAKWAPSYASARKTERFKAYVRAAGYVDYWRQKGWPDLCRPVGANDFVCD